MHCTADFCMCHYAGFSQIGSQMWAILEVYITTNPISFKFDCKVMYMYSIKYVNLIKICLVVPEIQGVEIRNFLLPVNNTLCVLCLSWPLTHDRVS